MVTIDDSGGSLRISVSPRRFLAFYLLFMLVMVVLAARDILGGESQGQLILAMVGMGVGVLAILLYVEATVIICDPATRTVTWHSQRPTGTARHSLPLDDIMSAISEGPFGKDKGSGQRPTLVTRDGRSHPMRGVYIPRRHARRIVAAINGWLGTVQPPSA